MRGEIIEGFPGTDDPFALTDATIYVPTRRAARALAGEIGRHLPHRTALLPRIVPLGQMEGIENSLVFGEPAGDDALLSDLSAAVPEIRRRMVLSAFVLAWGRALRGAILTRDGDLDPESALVATSPAQAWHLAGDLAGLIDEIIIEGVPWSALARLAPDDYDRYWRITLDFLKIAADGWPAYLSETGQMDGARRQAELAEREAARLTSGDARSPVIAIGSTGTNRATARLLAAIAHAPRGAVVLPGLDLTLDAATWSLIGGDRASRLEPAAGHPQAALFRLLPQLGIERRDVSEIGRVPDALAARMRFLSEAFVPAEASERWRSFSRAADADSLSGLVLVEAADEREEALALAIAMREALETPEATAALITPDRDLARRVRAELARWSIDIDDSGGDSLATSRAGQLARLALAAGPGVRAPTEVLGLLAHPATRLGFDRARLADLSGHLEIGLLRTVLPDDADLAELIETARSSARNDPHAHPARRRIGDQDWADLYILLQRLEAALADWRTLAAAKEPQPLASWIEAHRTALATIVEGASELGDDWNALAVLLQELSQSGRELLSFSADDYAAFIDTVLREAIVRGPRQSHPRLKILGLLEARLLSADVVLLGGLDETIWPPQTSTDAFLNRPMRAELGLSPPERRIGQTAHDFVQAMGARTVIISRAAKRGGAPTVASRFVQRMTALAGDAAWTACRERGVRLVELARHIDRPATIRSAPRPAPRPPLDLRPRRLSVTRIETLRRDPYAIHAEFILRLVPLDALGVEIGAREAGTELHGALADFVLDHPLGAWPADARENLFSIAQERLEPLLRNAEWRAFQWPRMQRGLNAFLLFEQERRANLAAIHVEAFGRLSLTLADGSDFEITGLADRIEELTDGSIAILDYKSGAIPTARMIQSGFSPQLSLEAAMLERGAFAAIPAGRHVSQAAHVALLGQDVLGARSIASKTIPLEALVSEHFEGFRQLVEQFRNYETPYVPRPFPQFASRYGAYDHLARVKEWSAGEEGESA